MNGTCHVGAERILHYTTGNTKGTDVIMIPDKALLFPAWQFCLPFYWVCVCPCVPFMEANTFKIYEENGSLKLDYLSKNVCSGSIKYSRKKIILDICQFG